MPDEPPKLPLEALPASISDKDFILCLITALLALMISATALIGGYAIFSPRLAELKAGATGPDARAWTFRGSDLIPRMGLGEETESAGLRITRLEQGIDNRAIFTRRTRAKAADYPFLETTITGRNPAARFYLIWRTEENPEEVHNTILHWAGDEASTYQLAKNRNWRGTIIEVGIDVYGDLRDQETTIQSLTLLPASSDTLLKSIWVEWTALRTWTQKSTNYLLGHTSDGTVSPTFATALWAGLSLAIVALISLVIRSRIPIAYCLAVLLPWICLDLLWQSNLSSQLKETKYLFAGKNQHEKHLADRESALYQYARHLKNEALPKPGSKIFLLRDLSHRDYTRLKMQHYLLPQNIYNYDRLPRPSKLRAGDYLLVLGEIEELSYIPEKGQLRWGKQRLDVELIDDHESGQLFIVRPR